MEENLNIEIYKILNERVQKEIDEMYDVHRLHFVSVTALITICGFAYQNAWLNLICGLAGLMICIIWWSAAYAQERWKLWWTQELAKIENNLPGLCIWKKLIFNESAVNTQLMEDLGKPEKIIDPPPYMKSVDSLLRYRPVIFGAICMLAIVYGGYGIVTGSTIVEENASSKEMTQGQLSSSIVH